MIGKSVKSTTSTLNNQRSVCHIVRRFGRVGGMESYVWHLSHCQLDLGYQVNVITEEILDCYDCRIYVIPIKRAFSRHRYQQMLEFRAVVSAAIKSNRSLNGSVIHSHERSTGHHVTTFHGSPMLVGFLNRLLSKRVRAWLEMERTELLSDSCKAIVPVSRTLGKLLARTYPAAETKIRSPGYPGVLQSNSAAMQVGFPPRLLFVGKEWKRKGLDRSLRIFKMFRERYPGATLDVFGPSTDQRSKIESAGAVYHGWSVDIDFSRFHILIHPALVEPFGMVVSEALAVGCGVLCSNQVGARELVENSPQIVSVRVSSSDKYWCSALCRLWEARQQFRLIHVPTWTDLASFYDTIYEDLSVSEMSQV